MDGERFDRWAKAMAGRQSRRSALRNLGAGIVAGLGALGLGGAAAAPGGQGKGKGEPGGNRCGGPGQPCKWNRQCCEFAGLVCLDGACTCPDNFCEATGACVDACPAGKVYNPTTCECVCAEGCGDGASQDPETCACTCVEQHCCECILVGPDETVCLGDVNAGNAQACFNSCTGEYGGRVDHANLHFGSGVTWGCGASGSCVSLCAGA